MGGCLNRAVRRNMGEPSAQICEHADLCQVSGEHRRCCLVAVLGDYLEEELKGALGCQTEDIGSNVMCISDHICI